MINCIYKPLQIDPESKEVHPERHIPLVGKGGDLKAFSQSSTILF